MIFSPSKEGYSGIAMLTSLNDNLQIEVYYRDNKNWFLSIMPLEKHTKRKFRILIPLAKSEGKISMRHTLNSELLTAQIQPVSISPATHKPRIEALFLQKEYRTDSRTTYLYSSL